LPGITSRYSRLLSKEKLSIWQKSRGKPQLEPGVAGFFPWPSKIPSIRLSGWACWYQLSLHDLHHKLPPNAGSRPHARPGDGILWDDLEHPALGRHAGRNPGQPDHRSLHGGPGWPGSRSVRVGFNPIKSARCGTWEPCYGQLKRVKTDRLQSPARRHRSPGVETPTLAMGLEQTLRKERPDRSDCVRRQGERGGIMRMERFPTSL